LITLAAPEAGSLRVKNVFQSLQLDLSCTKERDHGVQKKSCQQPSIGPSAPITWFEEELAIL
jgi:hypothetical protein